MTGKYNGTSPRQNQVSGHSHRHHCNHKNEKQKQYVAEDAAWNMSKPFEKQGYEQQHDADRHNQIHQCIVNDEEIQKIQYPYQDRNNGGKHQAPYRVMVGVLFVFLE